MDGRKDGKRKIRKEEKGRIRKEGRKDKDG